MDRQPESEAEYQRSSTLGEEDFPVKPKIQPKYYFNNLTEGQYWFQVVGYTEDVSKSGHDFYRLQLVLAGTDRLEYDYLYDSEPASWKWKAYGIETLDQVDSLVGQYYYMRYQIEEFDGSKRGQPKSILARWVG